MLRIYVAGPYNDDNVISVLDNMRRGMRASVKVLKAGMSPFCPWLDYHFSLIDDSLTIQDYYNYSMAWVEASDALYVVHYRETSVGTKAEIERAEELGIPVFYNGQWETLLAWKEEQENIDLTREHG